MNDLYLVICQTNCMKMHVENVASSATFEGKSIGKKPHKSSRRALHALRKLEWCARNYVYCVAAHTSKAKNTLSN